MTPQQQTTAILSRIREVCPELMERTRGCEFYDKDAIDWARHITLVAWNCKNGLKHFCEPDGSVFGRRNNAWFDSLEVIGHPVHLEHLMRAIKEYLSDGYVLELGIDGLYFSHDLTFHKYDLTLTVEQNLKDNEALRDFIYELICKV